MFYKHFFKINLSQMSLSYSINIWNYYRHHRAYNEINILNARKCSIYLMQKNAAIIYSYTFLVYFKDMHLNTIYVFGIGKWAKLYRKHAINSKMFMIYSLFPPKCFLIHCKIKIIWQASARFRADVHNVILSLKCLCSILRFFVIRCYHLSCT